jgi:glycosyltransferase involved in cell wall biosynthesis
MRPVLYVVVPCYNEQEVLPETSKRLKAKMTALIETGRIDDKSRVMLVNDGSRDRTWAMIEELHDSDPLFSGVKLSRNRGHQNALLAGLMTAKEYADVSISMDADLQDDIDAMDRFLDEFDKGSDVVYGVRSERKNDTAFKRLTAEGFYKLLKALGVDTVFNHADYRLLSRQALEGLAEFREVNLFLRGMVPLVGFKSSTVMYERHERFAGESKYPLKKMLALALDGITSLSIRPIRLILGLGVIIFLLSLVMLLYALISKWSGHADTGWTSILASIWMIGGIQLLCLGVIGEYIGKIYSETKQRPRYIIEKILK